MPRDLAPHQRILCAVDAASTEAAQNMVTTLTEAGEPLVGGIKLGLEFYTAQGPAGVRAVADADLPLFLDLKLHDIPNTVAGAVRAAMALNPAFLTIHASGGPAMIQAAAEAARTEAEASNRPHIDLLAVTVLTSLDADDLAAIGQDHHVADQVRRLGELAIKSGATGLVCAPYEVGFLREDLCDDVVLVVPGIRPAMAAKDDQKRVMTPAEAVMHGADYLVIGRPITAAPDPVAAARAIVRELAED